MVFTAVNLKSASDKSLLRKFTTKTRILKAMVKSRKSKIEKKKTSEYKNIVYREEELSQDDDFRTKFSELLEADYRNLKVAQLCQDGTTPEISEVGLKFLFLCILMLTSAFHIVFSYVSSCSISGLFTHDTKLKKRISNT